MASHADLITAFYTAFQRLDAEAMGRCYHSDVEFSDPVFQRLIGQRARDMWRMLCERGKDLRLEFSAVTADAEVGSAHWEAWYTFSATGRPVHNVIEASFWFRDGLIVRHVDDFGLRAWAAQALGLKGTLLGWAPPVQNAIRVQAARGLDQFVRRNSPSRNS
ncbi:MAG: nuclear transport factor 2 family protein [Acidobacteriota bacterium]